MRENKRDLLLEMELMHFGDYMHLFQQQAGKKQQIAS
jgi:hypothetical protein